ncbi:non-ribosomal peptide synthetase [Corynebacterium cystitidis]|uniref:Enterobactin synthetase component F n=1 Tax=Corynebacterium cystitidis DSM 20524 TaxID=1121357 RepID=A0A1H9RFJ8_9CORY|nr:non-ribosomal peptide synthetase [Corynebacterium cystitidis]WJY81455.1 Enterobactin synthase component F [Corynebacterium cystitidis DSM 20524]SER71325.1 enterobactin synthetase component F [Corynebacterium cystitidis DSM 20524]SNV87314.1 nonribosomal peptide synthetase [Corynebacterium cystitidis]
MFYRLSPAQTSLWFAQQYELNSASFQCAEKITFTHSMDATLLADTIRDCLEQLPVFHGVFREHDDGHPVLDTSRPQPVSVQCYRADDPAIPKVSEFVQVPSSPELSGEQLTGHVLIGDGQDLVWLARFHHMVCDGFAIQALVRWILHSYEGRRLANQVPIPTSPPPFLRQEAIVEVAEAYERSQDFERDRASWRDIDVSGPHPRLMPPGPQLLRGQGSISQQTRVRLRETMRGISKTANHLVGETQLLNVLLAHYYSWVTGQEEVSIGVPHMNRALGVREIGLEPAVTVLPFHYQAQQATLRDEVIDASHTLERLRAHSRYRVENLRRDKAIADPAVNLHGPNMNVRPFNQTITVGSVQATWQTLAVGPIKDAEFICQTTTDGGYDVIVFCYTSAKQKAVLDQHVARFVRFVEKVAELLPDDRLSQVDLLLPEETEQLASWNQTKTTPPRHSTLVAAYHASRAQVLQRNASDIALKAAGTTLTWRELYAEIDRRAKLLHHRGVGPGVCVAVHLPRGVEQFLTVAAVVATGGYWLPIAMDIPLARRDYMIEIVCPEVIIDADYRWDSAGNVACHDVSEAVVLKGLDLAHAKASDPAYVLFTSGSTGQPKGVQNNQEGIINRLQWMVDALELRPTDTLMQKTACSFDVSVWEFLLPLTHGIPIAIGSEHVHREPQRLAEEIATYEVTVCHFVPSALKAFLSVPAAQVARSSLRTVVTSGEALDAHTAGQARENLQVDVVNLYGPTEASIDVTAYWVRETDEFIPIGAPVANTQCTVVDRFLRPVAVGTPGVLYLGGVQLADGYVARPELTETAFIHHVWPVATATRWYNTGDIVTWLPQGVLAYQGRVDNQVKIRGQRVELGEVEYQIMQVDGVRSCTVQLREFHGAHHLMAYVVPEQPYPQPNTTLLDTVRERIGSQLAAYMVPQFFFTVAHLPLTVNGKLDVQALPLPQEVSSSVQRRVPGNDIERAIADVWATALGVNLEALSVSDNFFALGGTSLSAVEVAVGLSAIDGAPEVRVADVFARPSIRQQATLWSRTADQPRRSFSSWVEIVPHARGVPVVCVYPAGGVGWAYAPLAARLEPGRGLYLVQSPGLMGAQPRSVTAAARAVVEDVRKHVPADQPIDLVGWSVGGIIAQEVACMLSPTTVHKLLLLDAYPAHAWAGVPEPTAGEIHLGLLHMAGIKPEEKEISFDHAVAVLHGNKGAFSQLTRQELQSITQVILSNAAIMRTHDTRVYAGRMTHVQALDNDVPFSPDSWMPYAETVDKVALELTHPGLVSPVGLDRIGKLLA